MIYCIVAVENGHGIGFNGQMPWPRLDKDLKWFKRCTSNNVVIMGSATWKSLGSTALPDRVNVVISSSLQVGASFTYTDPIEAIKDIKERFSNKDIYIIGGQQLYDSTKELVDVFSITEINKNYECDKQFNLAWVKENYHTLTEIMKVDSTETTPAYTITEYKKT